MTTRSYTEPARRSSWGSDTEGGGRLYQQLSPRSVLLAPGAARAATYSGLSQQEEPFDYRTDDDGAMGGGRIDTEDEGKGKISRILTGRQRKKVSDLEPIDFRTVMRPLIIKVVTSTNDMMDTVEILLWF
jgi:hypothetical protein